MEKYYALFQFKNALILWGRSPRARTCASHSLPFPYSLSLLFETGSHWVALAGFTLGIPPASAS